MGCEMIQSLSAWKQIYLGYRPSAVCFHLQSSERSFTDSSSSDAKVGFFFFFLGGHRYQIEFKRTCKHANTDGLSRLPLDGCDTKAEKEIRKHTCGFFFFYIYST